MDTKSPILLGAFTVLVIAGVLWKYDAMLQRHDFIIHDVLSCDPSSEVCFVSLCDDEEPECDDTPYKKISKNAQYIPPCPNHTDECPELACAYGEPGCEITLCSEDTLEEGEACTGPVQEADESDAIDETPAEITSEK